MKGACRQRGHRYMMSQVWSVPGCGQGMEGGCEAWTSASPAATWPTSALSNAADVSYVKTESVALGDDSSYEQDNGLTVHARVGTCLGNVSRLGAGIEIG